MGGMRETVVGSPGYGPSKDSYLRPNPKRDASGIFAAIEKLWQQLFGRKSSEWSEAEEAKDREARARVQADWKSKGFVK